MGPELDARSAYAQANFCGTNLEKNVRCIFLNPTIRGSTMQCTMRNWLQLLLCLAFFASAGAQEAQGSPLDSPCCEDCSDEKVYVAPHDISIRDNGIYIFVEPQWIQTASLHSDARGIYVQWDTKCGTYEWLCKKCKRCNFLLLPKCPRCNYSPVGIP